MSKETMEWLHDNVLVGFSDKRGAAWWASRGLDSTDSSGEPNHYTGAIPLEDVLRRLPAFRTDVLTTPLTVTYTDPATGKDVTFVDSEHQVILRPDINKVYGVRKSGYDIHQLRTWLIEKASAVLDTSTSELGIANVVTLKNGAVAAVQYEVPENVKTAEGVEFRPSLLTATSFDGTLQTIYKRVITNCVCDNTTTAALSEDSPTVKHKHTKYSINKMEGSLTALRASLEIEFIADAFTAEIARWCETKVSGKQFLEFLTVINPIPEDDGRKRTMAENRQDAYLNLWMNDNRVAPWAGTAFGVLQMTNTYMQHVAPTNEGTIRYEKNMFNAVNGKIEENDTETIKALELILA